MLVLDNVSKAFGSHQAVNALSMSVDAGIVCGFLGPNGAWQDHDDADDCRHHPAFGRHGAHRRDVGGGESGGDEADCRLCA